MRDLLIEGRVVRDLSAVDFDVETLITNVTVFFVNFTGNVSGKSRSAATIPVVGQTIRFTVFVRFEIKRQHGAVRLLSGLLLIWSDGVWRHRYRSRCEQNEKCIAHRNRHDRSTNAQKLCV